MRKKRKYSSLIFRLIAFIISLYAITQMNQDRMMGGSPLVFFTIQSNILVSISFLLLIIVNIRDIIKHKNKCTYNTILHTAVVVYISITFLVFWGLLSWNTDPIYLFTPHNILLHFLIPVLAIIDWIFYIPHGRLKNEHSIYFLIYPLLYYIFTIIRSKIGEPLGIIEFKGNIVELKYPYFFIEPSLFTRKWLLITIILFVCCLFYLIGIFYVKIDRYIKKVRRKKKWKFIKLFK